MSQRILLFIKSILKYWFLLLVIIIIIVAIYNLEIATWITAISITILVISYILTHFFKNKLIRFMKKFYRIEEETVAQDIGCNLEELQEKMFILSQNQEKEPWLIVFLNKKYIFYHPETILYFNELYDKGYDEIKMFEKLKEYDIFEISEIKAIRETLIKLNRLEE